MEDLAGVQKKTACSKTLRSGFPLNMMFTLSCTIIGATMLSFTDKATILLARNRQTSMFLSRILGFQNRKTAGLFLDRAIDGIAADMLDSPGY